MSENYTSEFVSKFNDNTLSLLEQYGEDITDELKGKVTSRTGKTVARIDYTVDDSGNISLKIEYPEHLIALFEGASPIRGRTNGKFIDSLKEWSKIVLGLDDARATSFAFAYMKYRASNPFRPPRRFEVNEYIESEEKQLDEQLGDDTNTILDDNMLKMLNDLFIKNNDRRN